ncbi:hypothetical protein AVEN_105646-1 [Araneus ventricosus]|uniref:Uncharacterized protein n=1 Tax=Araneus ventricosus TaxID=182803 RepID=A0A4Y2X5I1_ARAVE|nr:hypothetical protein AVEN_105646-1 [Araneus ventricosus]
MKGDITPHLINEVAAFIPGEHFTTLDIALLAHDDELAKVADAYTFYDASRYPLNFRIIQGGYHFKNTSNQPKQERYKNCPVGVRESIQQTG